MQELIGERPLVVAAGPLRETLGRDVLASVKANLERVVCQTSGDVVSHLVEVLDGELRRVAVCAKLQVAQVIVVQLGNEPKPG